MARAEKRKSAKSPKKRRARLRRLIARSTTPIEHPRLRLVRAMATEDRGASPVGGPPPAIPSKRQLEDDHTPAVSSPLNPEAAAARARGSKAPATREQREKKETFKKREGKTGTPDLPNDDRDHEPNTTSPVRYKLPPPKPTDYDAPKAPVLTPHHAIQHEGEEIQFYESSEHVYNRKGFRYTHCIADPAFPSSLFYRQTETYPYEPRINFEDSSSHILFTKEGKAITTEKGFRMARANVGVREGKWYWECKILSGVHQEGDPTNLNTGGHVRMGWARREAVLDAPVGFDAYSYGIRDVGGQRVHMSRPKDFFPPGESICEGDVIGLEINLPPLGLHKKVVDGDFNPAVDISDGMDGDGELVPDIIRDRVPIRYKAQLYFEQFEYHSTKELEELHNPAPYATGGSTHPASSQSPNPNHSIVSMRTLPFSKIKVYKNGKFMGTPFTDLLAFLPPASKPLPQVGARDGLDDGMLGYFPAVSVFKGGAAQVNFGPDFWYPPADLKSYEDVDMIDASGPDSQPKPPSSELRGAGERYVEQIAEDIVYDLIDEVDFWMQDGGSTEVLTGATDSAPTVLGPVDPEAPGVAALANEVGGGHGGGIKEIVQEDE